MMGFVPEQHLVRIGEIGRNQVQPFPRLFWAQQDDRRCVSSDRHESAAQTIRTRWLPMSATMVRHPVFTTDHSSCLFSKGTPDLLDAFDPLQDVRVFRHPSGLQKIGKGQRFLGTILVSSFLKDQPVAKHGRSRPSVGTQAVVFKQRI